MQCPVGWYITGTAAGYAAGQRTGGHGNQWRTEGSGLRANYLRTLLGSGQVGSGANREAATPAADRKGRGADREAAAPAADCRWTALGPWHAFVKVDDYRDARLRAAALRRPAAETTPWRVPLRGGSRRPAAQLLRRSATLPLCRSPRRLGRSGQPHRSRRGDRHCDATRGATANRRKRRLRRAG